MSTHHIRTATATTTLVVLASLAGGCGRFGSSDAPTTVSPVELACDPPASQSDDLRAPITNVPAMFTTDGSGLFVTVSGFEHGLPFDPNVGSSAIYVGSAQRMPTYDRKSAEVSDALVRLSAKENQPTELDLPAGRYWLWASNSPRIMLWGCAEGSVTDATSGGG